ncbi:MAG: DUF1501 domain-containing protein [Solirubrobacteraceae bacterium]
MAFRTSPHHACEDFHRTAATARHPSIGVSRRHFLGWGAGAGLTLYTANAMPLQHWMDGADVAAAQDPNGRILVSVFLPGGLDLLDSFMDISQYATYSQQRGDAARPLTADPLSGTTLSAHPSLSAGQNGGVRGLFETGRLGLLPGIDYANPDLSHFHSRAFWETGTITPQQTTGWLGRWLDQYGTRSNPFQGLTSGSRLSPTLLTSAAPVSSIESTRSAEMKMPLLTPYNRGRAMKAYGDLAKSRRNDQLGRASARAAARFAQEVADRLAPLSDDGPAAPPAGTDVDSVVNVTAPIDGYPAGSGFSKHLKQLAFLISQPLGARIATVDGRADFDTHQGQPARLERALSDVSASLAAFQYDLEARGMGDRVLTFVWTEFGRRPEGNRSLGTDHGAGGIAMVMGTQAATGLRTEYPSLRNLDGQDNLKVTVDFRGVYASLIEQWLGTPADGIIPDAASFPRVGLVK